jgi:LTXXQ motif family protein
MRTSARITIVSIPLAVLVYASLVSFAAAQFRGGHAAAASGRAFSAPAPHFSAPAARFSAPAARFSAPAPRFVSPAPHFASPMARSTPAPYMPAHRFAAPPTALPNNLAPRVGGPGVAAPFIAAPGRGVVTPNGAPAFGSAPVLGNRGPLGSAQSLVHGPNGAPMLRNPAFANTPGRDPTSRALAQSTFGGRFAHSAFGFDRGWHHHHFGRVLGFVGVVFWPYAYDDFFAYTFSPYAYDTFWPSAYDDVLSGIYGGYAPAYSDYNADYAAQSAYAPQAASAPTGTAYVYGDQTGAWVARGEGPTRVPVAPSRTASARQICSGQTNGIADFPIQRIAEQVKPDQDQQALLDGLKAATGQAVDILQAACPSDLPSTPTGRLAAQRSRVEAMLQAVRVIDPALQRFYGALNDEQKARFNGLDAERLAAAENQPPDAAELCGGAAQAADLPFGSIEQALRLNDAQRTSLNAVKESSVRAHDMLKPNCGGEPALTPTARLAQMKQRLEAMLEVLNTVQPPLASFYGSLDDEQKARLNRLGVRAP